jgi:two-component system response regulator
MEFNIKNVEYLLVEDNPNDAELIIRALNKIINTNNLLLLEDGETTMNFIFGKGEYAKKLYNKQLKAIFLDLKLPKINGLEILKEIKRDPILQKIPVIIFTSSKEDFDIKTAYNLGANSYVVKPMDYKSFTETIIAIGNYWINLNVTIE